MCLLPVLGLLAACGGVSEPGVDGSVDASVDASVLPEEPLPVTGFFTVAERAGQWYLVTPEGDPFYSIGVNVLNTRPYVDQQTGVSPYLQAVNARYDDHEAWATAQASRLEQWGFNTVGAWSEWELFAEQVPYTLILNLAGADWQAGTVPDYFDPGL